MEALPRGFCLVLPTALEAKGAFDANSQERLLASLPKAPAFTLLSASAAEGLSEEQARAVNASVHFTAGPRSHFAGITGPSVSATLAGLEQALGLGFNGALLSPLLLADCKDPLQLFHRHLLPFLEGRRRSLSILLEDALGKARLKTSSFKQLSRLEPVGGTIVSGGPKIVGNYLKAARHFKARHEFGAYLSDAELIFSLFRPARGAVDTLREHWTRLWMGELPQGIAPMSGVLFPSAWAAAWAAALAGDHEKMDFFATCFEELGEVAYPHLRTALKEEGLFSFDSGPSGERVLSPSEREAWLQRYRRTKERLSKVLILPSAEAPAEAARRSPARRPAQVAGIGGVVLDELYPVSEIRGAESKVKIRAQAQRYPGGVMLNQLSWLAALGVPSSLFGFTGRDRQGAWLKQQARLRGIEVSQLKSSSSGTEVAKIFVGAKGEREIYLMPGAVCATEPKQLAGFEALIESSPYLSLEISLLPLKAVKELMRLARRYKKKIFLDLDIPVSQATGEGGLGSRADLDAILRQADFLKSSKDFLRELGPNTKAVFRKLGMEPGQWLAATQGVKGSEIFDGKRLLKVAAPLVKEPVDSTGCGDAYMAGLIAGSLWGWDLEPMGRLASACGAACVTRMGGAAPLGEARTLILRYAKGLKLEAPALEAPAEGLGAGQGASFMQEVQSEMDGLLQGFSEDSFEAAKGLIRAAEAQGRRLHVTGVGKPEYVAGYIASSFSSTGTPAFFLHATEAGHGASGQVSAGDVVIAISNSGETEEMKSAVATVKRNGAKLIGVTGHLGSWLARQSDVALFAGVSREGDLLNMAPRASVIAELLVLSALGVELQEEKEFSADDFRNFHPGGALGKRR